MKKQLKKVLVLGSGALKIGQAGEFDYSGSQALKALREEGISSVLVNPNIATIQTSEGIADKVYFQPVTTHFVTEIIKKERPDGILLAFGGQTALNCGTELYTNGTLQKYGVEVLGTSVEAIMNTEDRDLFVKKLAEVSLKVPVSHAVENMDDALKAARSIGFPIMIRSAYALGGLGSGICPDEEAFKELAESAFTFAPQILVEESLKGWKEIEFECIRDANDHCFTVASMENFDPLGIHTGESIVVAPTCSLTPEQVKMLQDLTIKCVRHLNIVGECNIQFAFNAETNDYRIIEINARLSRSSALASKATGYPIAKVATKIAIGYRLHEIVNAVTGHTYAAFEPALDYVAVKYPKWPFDKFVYAKRNLGTQMKATGEVMAISDSFESALMKAVRGAEISADTLHLKKMEEVADEDLMERCVTPTDERLFYVAEAIRRGVAIDKETKIDMWFLSKIRNLVEFEKNISGRDISFDEYVKAKKLGFTDKAIARITGKPVTYELKPTFKMVDTCAGEFEAHTPYFYATFNRPEEGGENEADFEKAGDKDKQTVIVFGSGPIRIGQGIEFDYAAVHCVHALRDLGYRVVIVNNNPETVSTDFDTGDRLYFEPLTPEDVMNIVHQEKPFGVVVAFGGQTAIKLTKTLSENNINIIGTSADSIDMAEDRERFDELLERLGIARPKGFSVLTLEEDLPTFLAVRT